MAKLEVVFRRDAVDDLEDIFRFVRHLAQDRATARAYIDRIRDRCERIGRTPHASTTRDDLSPGLRTVPFERRAVIAFRIVDARVEIVNVFHGGRDFEALCRRPPYDPDA